MSARLRSVGVAVLGTAALVLGCEAIGPEARPSIGHLTGLSGEGIFREARMGDGGASPARLEVVSEAQKLYAHVVDIVPGDQGGLWILDEFGTISRLDQELRQLQVLSLSHAFRGLMPRPLSLVLDGERVGAWVPSESSIYWMTLDGDPLGKDVTRISPDRIALGSQYVFDPQRRHGRLLKVGGDFLLEVRPPPSKEAGGIVTGALVKVNRDPVDTVWTAPVTSYAVRSLGTWICCNRPPLFGGNLSWDARPDGTIVAATTLRPELLAFGELGSVVGRIQWGGGRSAVSRRDALRQWEHDAVMSSERGASRYLGRAARDRRRRFSRFAGFVADSTPSFSEVRTDDKGRIWLRAFDVRAWPEGLADTWDVLDARGVHCARVRAPQIDHVFYFRAGLLAGTKQVHRNVHQLRILRADPCD